MTGTGREGKAGHGIGVIRCDVAWCGMVSARVRKPDFRRGWQLAQRQRIRKSGNREEPRL